MTPPEKPIHPGWIVLLIGGPIALLSAWLVTRDTSGWTETARVIVPQAVVTVSPATPAQTPTQPARTVATDEPQAEPLSIVSKIEKSLTDRPPPSGQTWFTGARADIQTKFGMHRRREMIVMLQMRHPYRVLDCDAFVGLWKDRLAGIIEDGELNCIEIAMNEARARYFKEGPAYNGECTEVNGRRFYTRVQVNGFVIIELHYIDPKDHG